MSLIFVFFFVMYCKSNFNKVIQVDDIPSIFPSLSIKIKAAFLIGLFNLNYARIYIPETTFGIRFNVIITENI